MFCKSCGASIHYETECPYCGVILVNSLKDSNNEADNSRAVSDFIQAADLEVPPALGQIPTAETFTEKPLNKKSPTQFLKINPRNMIKRLASLCILILLVAFAISNFEIWVANALGDSKDLYGEVSNPITYSAEPNQNSVTIKYSGYFKNTCGKPIATAKFTIEFKDVSGVTVASSTVTVRDIDAAEIKAFSGECISFISVAPSSYVINSAMFM